MNSLAWKWNRLRMMAPAEIIWRSKKAIQFKIGYDTRAAVQQPPKAKESLGRSWVDPMPTGFDPANYLNAADQILAGRFNVFALRGVTLGFPPRWNRDPKTGTEAPLALGKALNYRDERVVGDIKYLWEINRHYELVTLAQAWYFSGEKSYAVACRVLVESWVDQSPYLCGPGWSSSLENSIRLVNWAVAWQLLVANDGGIFDDEDGQLFKQRWENSIYQHCQFIAGHLSFYSSANNHLFGEYMGLFIGAITWPCWEDSARWRMLAKKGLEQEALKQNARDGVNWEQAIWYHHEVADMMLLCGLFGKANGIAFSKEYWQRLEKMLEFIVAMMDVAGNVPMIGDSDDAVMVRFSQEPHFDVYRSLLATGAVLFSREDFKIKAGGFDDKSRWLLGNLAAETVTASSAGHSCNLLARTFPDGGYYVLGDNFNTACEVKIIADAGRLGYLSIAAHGHADALAFTLSVAGKPLLIDPGTYAYHTQKKWRDYFRGTSAHNTVRVDGLDQSDPGGNFMWLRKANATCELWEIGDDRDCFIGSHDGYLRLSDPVRHRRKIVFLKRERKLVVEDILECSKAHEIEFHWHFFNTCKLLVEGGKVFASSGNVSLQMTMPECDWNPQIITGKEHPPLGWLSCRFDQKTATPAAVWKGKINGGTTRVTIFQLSIHAST